MDRITKNLLDQFVEQNSLEALEQALAFEHFCGYLVVSAHYSESFSSYDISVGAGGDCGIDCIAILVNGALVNEPEEIEDLAETNGYLDVSFIFVQSERSSSFNTAKIGQFVYGVCDFFSEAPQLPQNERIKHYARIVKEIFDRSSLFKKGNPQCFLYYATTGKWQDDNALIARKDSGVSDVESTGLFRNAVVEYVDADRLQRLYRDSQNAVSTEITFSEKAVIPEIPGVEQAYIGMLSAPEFLKLIENSNQQVLTSLFYDNIRHWQEWNPVNSEMKETLSNSDNAKYFPLLNNGVTIIAKQIRLTGNKFLLEDYQIANGCQTSYVLHECREGLNDDVMVPVRLIATEDDEIKNKIIKATNRQTPVTEDMLFALSDFPKKLEAYFPSFDDKKTLYYERRSRQYNHDSSIEKVRVINMTSLVRAYAAVFLRIPHRTTRNYKALLRMVGGDVFNKEHKLEPYYVSAYAHYRLEYLFRNQTLPAELKPARYHLLMAYRMLVGGDSLPHPNSNMMVKFCESIMENLWKDVSSKQYFELAADYVRNVADGNLHRDNIRTESFTENLIVAINSNSTT